jgi:Holliday junction resolvase
MQGISIMVTNKRRGYEVEREVVKLWQGLGVPCKRILASGAFKHWGKNLAGDVELNGLLVEVKRRKNGTGFASLYKWLEQDDAKMLICRADNKKRLYVIPEEVMIQFAKDMGWMLGFKATETVKEGDNNE